jgi:glycyl-tRNA synthetase beta chain
MREAVDTFFDQVMVMADEPIVRNNRLALLSQLETLMNRVADISKLAT